MTHGKHISDHCQNNASTPPSGKDEIHTRSGLCRVPTSIATTSGPTVADSLASFLLKLQPCFQGVFAELEEQNQGQVGWIWWLWLEELPKASKRRRVLEAGELEERQLHAEEESRSREVGGNGLGRPFPRVSPKPSEVVPRSSCQVAKMRGHVSPKGATVHVHDSPKSARVHPRSRPKSARVHARPSPKSATVPSRVSPLRGIQRRRWNRKIARTSARLFREVESETSAMVDSRSYSTFTCTLASFSPGLPKVTVGQPVSNKTFRSGGSDQVSL